MDKEVLLGEIEDLLRNMPPQPTLRHPTDENFSWFGRVSALIEKWNSSKSPLCLEYLNQFTGKDARVAWMGFHKLMILLHQARNELRMETLGPINIAVAHGMIFDYFDEIRKIIEDAKQDLFFVDPYLDAEFVSRYLVHVTQGVSIRLLAREKIKKLLPAVDTFVLQFNGSVEVRSAPNFHDRYIFVDKASCYQSGASFKNGAKNAPTTLTQITDAFLAVIATYTNLWDLAKVER